MVITEEQKAAYDAYTEAGRKLFELLNITDDERKQARLDLQEEDIGDWLDDDIFLAEYVYSAREVGMYDAEEPIPGDDGSYTNPEANR